MPTRATARTYGAGELDEEERDSWGRHYADRNGVRGCVGFSFSRAPFFSFRPGELCPVTYRAVVHHLENEEREKGRSKKSIVKKNINAEVGKIESKRRCRH
jgi:hypothetical protein